MAEGAAVIDIRVRAMMEGQVSQRLKDVENSAKQADAATRGLGNSARSAENDFKKFGNVVQEEVFELNTRKAKRFVDMFLGGGLFSIGMTLASKAVESLGEAIKQHLEEAAKTTTDRVNELIASIETADAKIKGIGADEFYKQAQLVTRQTEEALDLKQKELAQMESLKTASAVEHERLIGEVSELQSRLLDVRQKETEAQQMSLEIERSTMITIEKRIEAHKKEATEIKAKIQLQHDALLDGGQLAGPMGFRGHGGLTPEQQFGDYGQYEEYFSNINELEQRANEKMLNMALDTAGQFVGIWGDAFGQLVVNGQGSWNDIAKSMLGALGSMAMQMGSFLILAGAGFSALPFGFSGAGAIAAGAGLVLLGGTLKALAGGKSQTASSSPSTGGGGSYASSYSPNSSYGGSRGGQQQSAPQTIVINIGGQPVSDKASIGKAVSEAMRESIRLGYSPPIPSW